ncbi:MAG: T9SS type A sorting domain-containing protein, partial [Saprospiraceae bacterium]|nr:T9SS type A sorting domain-containing protein [Saprospiraceae bacterium]
ISYWNETMTEPVFAGGILDINGNDTLDISLGATPRYGGHTITSMPTMAINNKGGIIIVYSMVSEANFNELDEQHYRHLVAIKSLDNGATWGPPYDLINIDLVDEDFYEFVEAVYPSAHPEYNDTLYLIYQEDFFPGHTFNMDENDPQADNFITHFALPVDLVPDVSILATGEHSIREFVTVYPTITEGPISINVDHEKISDIEIVVFDMMGRVTLHNSKVSTSTQVDMSSLISGPYFLQVRSSKGNAVYKILKL